MPVRASRGALALGLATLLAHATVGAAATTDPAGRLQTLLGRSADGLGLSAFLLALQNGARDEDIIRAIVSSDEYFARL